MEAVAAEQYLRAWVRRPGMAQPLLLTSASEELLSEATQQLLLAAVCAEAAPCGTCASCRQALAGTHPDVIQAPDGTIKTIRHILSRVAETAVTGRRVIVLPHAERISLPAMQALLKSLEEPAPSARYVLTTRAPQRLPSTLRSRCQRLQLTAPAAAAAAPPPLAFATPLTRRTPLLGKNVQLTEAELAAIAATLSATLRQEGPSAALKHAFQRLRDYHLIRASGGNERSAREVLVLSLPARDGM